MRRHTFDMHVCASWRTEIVQESTCRYAGIRTASLYLPTELPALLYSSVWRSCLVTMSFPPHDRWWVCLYSGVRVSSWSAMGLESHSISSEHQGELHHQHGGHATQPPPPTSGMVGRQQPLKAPHPTVYGLGLYIISRSDLESGKDGFRMGWVGHSMVHAGSKLFCDVSQTIWDSCTSPTEQVENNSATEPLPLRLQPTGRAGIGRG